MNRVLGRVTIVNCIPVIKDGHTTITFAKVLGALTPAIDAYAGKTITLEQDGVLIFSGDISGYLDHFDEHLGWCREYMAHGLSKRAEYICCTDDNNLTDTIRFNTASDDPDDIPSRDGRSIGQVVATVLEMKANSAALAAAGIGNYTSAGTNAAATCTVSGGVVGGTITITNGGTGYTTAPTVLFSGGGGHSASGTATVSGGVVTGISLVSGGSGYTTPPIIILSRLPATTLADLDAMPIVPVFEVDVAGERILQALEGIVQSTYFNHFVQVDPNGDIRFYDPRTFPADITLQMGDGTGRVGLPEMTVDWSGCYSRCIVRGDDQVVAVTLGMLPWPGSSLADGGLAEYFAWGSFTNAQAKTNYQVTDFTQPGASPGTATATATLSGSTVGTLSIGFGGYGYASAPSVLVSGGGGSGCTATASITSGVVTSITKTASGTGYTSVPTVTLTGPAVGQSDVGTCTCPNTTTIRVTSANPHATWPANYWDQTNTGHHGEIITQSDTISNYTQKWDARIVANTALAAGGTSDLTIDTGNPLPATTYNTYQIYGEAGGASFVYRRYRVTNADIASRLANYFPYPRAYRNSDGTAATLVSTPMGTVYYNANASTILADMEQSPIAIAVDSSSGTILTAKPTCLVFSADGKTITPVNDIQVFLPVHAGALSVTWPADISGVPQYAGTAYAQFGLERTKTITVPGWRDYSNIANMTLMASEFLDSVKDIVYEGFIEYKGLLSSVLTAGHSLNITGNGYSTGWETLAIPIVAVELRYQERGGATSYVTKLSFSNRRAPFSGESLRRPAVVGQPFGSAEGLARLGFTNAGEMESYGQQFGQQMGEQSQETFGQVGAFRSMQDARSSHLAEGLGGMRDAMATGANGPIDISMPNIDITGGWQSPTQGDYGVTQNLADAGVDPSGGWRPTASDRRETSGGPKSGANSDRPLQSTGIRPESQADEDRRIANQSDRSGNAATPRSQTEQQQRNADAMSAYQAQKPAPLTLTQA